jgi:RNA polymerase sigma factor (sigma-70 family)
MRVSVSPLAQERPDPVVLDLLATGPSSRSFADRVRALSLSGDLERKVLGQDLTLSPPSESSCHRLPRLAVHEEHELAGEMLRQRHRFTEQLLTASRFRQAALTVIQNSYLFKSRRVFLLPAKGSIDQERQEALLLFSTAPPLRSLPLAKTFQHSLVARIWNRIVGRQTSPHGRDARFLVLHEIVENLNTLRNIYILLTRGLVRRLATRTRLAHYNLSFEDTLQIGTFGVARASYRYHPHCGASFSTHAAYWIQREIQQQALGGRLIRISSNSLEAHSRAIKDNDSHSLLHCQTMLATSDVLSLSLHEDGCQHAEPTSPTPSPEALCEQSQLRQYLLDSIDQFLDGKKGDILKRRYGLPPYLGKEESVMAISKDLGVTRSSIYQLEASALRQLHNCLSDQE